MTLREQLIKILDCKIHIDSDSALGDYYQNQIHAIIEAVCETLLRGEVINKTGKMERAKEVISKRARAPIDAQKGEQKRRPVKLDK